MERHKELETQSQGDEIQMEGRGVKFIEIARRGARGRGQEWTWRPGWPVQPFPSRYVCGGGCDCQLPGNMSLGS